MSNLEIIYAYNTHKLHRGSLKINQYMSFIKIKKRQAKAVRANRKLLLIISSTYSISQSNHNIHYQQSLLLGAVRRTIKINSVAKKKTLSPLTPKIQRGVLTSISFLSSISFNSCDRLRFKAGTARSLTTK